MIDDHQKVISFVLVELGLVFVSQSHHHRHPNEFEVEGATNSQAKVEFHFDNFH